MTRLWRLCFLLTGALIMAGGPMHPNGTMAEMLADPDWIPSHALMTLGFAALALGLVVYRRAVPLPSGSARWAGIALLGATLQTVEMVLHTAAAVDLENLVAGESTPILSAHLWLTNIAYPVFGATMIGFIVATARDRVLASPWIAWLGILGAAAHGAAGPLTVFFELGWAPILFPMVILLALWLVAAAVWPLRAAATKPLAESA